MEVRNGLLSNTGVTFFPEGSYDATPQVPLNTINPGVSSTIVNFTQETNSQNQIVEFVMNFTYTDGSYQGHVEVTNSSYLANANNFQMSIDGSLVVATMVTHSSLKEQENSFTQLRRI